MIVTKDTEKRIIDLLADSIGVDAEDVSVEDTIVDDLHMSAVDLTDFATTLRNKGFDISFEDLTDLETVADLVEAASLKEDIA